MTNAITFAAGNSSMMISPGLELGVKGNLSDDWQLEINLAYSDVKNDNQELQRIKPGFSPCYLASMNLLYRLSSDMSV